MRPQLEKYLHSKKYKKEFDNLAISSDLVPEFMQLSENEDEQVRIRAIYALGRISENGMEDKDAVISTFLKALYDHNKWSGDMQLIFWVEGTIQKRRS